MPTLNGGFTHPKDSAKHMSETDRELIDSFIREKGIIECPPVGAQGSEITKITHERIMKQRADYRAQKRAEAKAKKEGSS